MSCRWKTIYTIPDSAVDRPVLPSPDFRTIVCIYCFMLCAIFFTAPQLTLAKGTSVLKGEILDIQGKPVDGAHVFVYKSKDVKRQPDFVSPSTSDGRYRVVLPSGKYWIIARLTREAYGPLLPGDKHSGEPEEVDLPADVESALDLTVADLREAAQIRKKTGHDYVKVEGRIIDETGQPVRLAYVVVHRSEEISGLPDFLSAWTGEDGSYSLSIPTGNHWIGALLLFPPKPGFILERKLVIGADEHDMDLLIRTPETEKN
jgi:hypothetical protein